jgi:hypothetical protein
VKSLVVFAMLGVLSIAAPAQQANVSGNWDLEMSWPDANSTGACTFQQEGERLMGTCGGADKFAVTGRVNGSKVSWHVEVEQGASAGRMEFAGEVDREGTTIRGTCTVVGANSGTFAMKRTR